MVGQSHVAVLTSWFHTVNLPCLRWQTGQRIGNRDSEDFLKRIPLL